jgi:hypothetical protein
MVWTYSVTLINHLDIGWAGDFAEVAISTGPPFSCTKNLTVSDAILDYQADRFYDSIKEAWIEKFGFVICQKHQ